MPGLTVLVTGAAGLVGSRIVRLLAERGASVVGFDKAARNTGDDICRWVVGDIRDQEAFGAALAANKVARIVHAASILQADVQKAPYLGVGVNAGGTLAVFEAAARNAVERVVFTSSIAVYGGTLADPMPESHPCAPVSIYGTAKLLGEQVGTVYAGQKRFGFTALRYGLVYGPGRVGSAGIASRFQDFVRAALEEGVIRLPRSNPRKPFLYADDAAAAAVHACLREETANGTFNISGQGHSMEEVGQALLALCPGARLVHEDLRMQPGEVNGFLDTTRAEQDLGFRPKVTLRDGLAAVAAYIRAQS